LVDILGNGKYMNNLASFVGILIPFFILLIVIGIAVYFGIRQSQYVELNSEILKSLNIGHWNDFKTDAFVYMKSSRAVDNYDYLKFFMENRNKVDEAYKRIQKKQEYLKKIKRFLDDNEFKNRPTYDKVEINIKESLRYLNSYNIDVSYTSPAGRSHNYRCIHVTMSDIEKIKNDPSLIMTKGEYNKYLKEQAKQLLDEKQHKYYEMVNLVIDVANSNRDKLVKKEDQEELDRLISLLFDKTVNSIKRVKVIDSEEWDVIRHLIINISKDVNTIIDNNQKILDYYVSPEFCKIKETCKSLMETQKEFNEYINEKAQAVSTLFGAKVVRNETVIDDEYHYVRPYKKTINAFTAEVSSSVFSSAENNPIDYIVKYFYPNKEKYPEQIQKLQTLVEELETLKDARKIIDNYKLEYQQYITDVPDYVMDNDEDGFYARLGFANISESALTVEYKFSYTSDGGFAQRYFTIPMTEDTIVDLINKLQSKLTMSAFAKEQRAMMTSKLRELIKERDNYSCRYCGNSIFNEPNLLLEIDHIVPVSKGGCTVESNLQTLCWKCNRQKSNKV